MQLLAALDVLRRKPDPQVRIAHPPMQPPGELLVLGTVGDEAGIELDRLHGAQQRRQVSNQGVGHAAAAEEALGNFAFGFIDRVDPDLGRTEMLNKVESFGFAKRVYRKFEL